MERLKPTEIAEQLEHEPLVGVTVAAKLLGIPASNFNRDASKHLTSVKIPGTGTLYFRSEVRKLKARRDRAKRSAERKAAAVR